MYYQTFSAAASFTLFQQSLEGPAKIWNPKKAYVAHRTAQGWAGPECFPDLGCHLSASGLSQSCIPENQLFVSPSPPNLYLKMVPRFTLKGSGFHISAKALLQKNSLEPIQRRFPCLINRELKLYQIRKKIAAYFSITVLFFVCLLSILWLLHANNLLVWMV